MKIISKVKSFEDACKLQGLNPDDLPVVSHLPEKDRNSIIAFYKLTIIIRALNEEWEADFSNHDQRKYWVYLWINSAGFAYSNTNYGPSYADSYIGSRLCFKNRELADYSGEQFIDLYRQYLLN